MTNEIIRNASNNLQHVLPIPSSSLEPAPTLNEATVASSSDCAPRLSLADRDRLLVEHLPEVRFIARRMHARLPKHVDLEDLVSAGNLGLIDALHKFDTRKQVRFKSYAQFRIQGAILDSLRIIDWGTRSVRRKGRAIEEAIHILTQQLDRSPSDNEIADQLGMALIDYQRLLSELNSLEIGSLHVKHTNDSGTERLAYLAGPEDDNPLFIAMKGEVRQHLMDALEKLSLRERNVLFLYYFEELTMMEIGRTLGIATSRVSQLRSSSVLRLRSAMLKIAQSKTHRVS